MQKLALLLACLILTTGLHAEDRRWSFMMAGGFSSYQEDFAGDPASLVTLNAFSTSSDPAFQQYQQVATIEALTPTTIESKETHGRLGFEYLFGDGMYFGLNFGLSYAAGEDSCISNCGELSQLALINLLNSGSSDPITQLLLLSSLLGSTGSVKSAYSTTMLDLGISGHFNARGSFDPYVGLDLGGGICSFDVAEEATCTVAKVAPKLGFRYHFSDAFYAYMQAEYQFQTFQANGASKTVENPVALIGLGVRW